MNKAHIPPYERRTLDADFRHKQVIARYSQEATIDEIAATSRYTRQSVRTILKRAGVLQPKPPKPPRPPAPKQSGPPDLDFGTHDRNVEIVALCDQGKALPMRERKVRGLTFAAIAAKYGVSGTRIEQIYSRSTTRRDMSTAAVLRAELG